jgi:hypothetical protein
LFAVKKSRPVLVILSWRAVKLANAMCNKTFFLYLAPLSIRHILDYGNLDLRFFQWLQHTERRCAVIPLPTVAQPNLPNYNPLKKRPICNKNDPFLSRLSLHSFFPSLFRV